MLLDLLVYPLGPRVRDRISHGEVSFSSVPRSTAQHLISICYTLALRFTTNSMFETKHVSLNGRITAWKWFYEFLRLRFESLLLTFITLFLYDFAFKLWIVHNLKSNVFYYCKSNVSYYCNHNNKNYFDCKTGQNLHQWTSQNCANRALYI